MERQSIKVYVTKHALSDKGIYEIKGFITIGGHLMVYHENGCYLYSIDKRDFELTIENAKQKAESMRIKEIKHLENKIKKLKTLIFYP